MKLYNTQTDLNEYAEYLSSAFTLELISNDSYNTDELHLIIRDDRLYLERGELSMCGDYSKSVKRLKQSNLEREILVKAIRIKNSTSPIKVVDATAGLGEDSLLLAAAGFRVDMYEYNNVIAALLFDTLRSSKSVHELSPAIENMRIINSDSVVAMQNMNDSPDVILLDPMFPARTKSSLIKKKFQLLQELESPCSNEEELLNAAIAAHPKKIVIKRPAKGPYLGGRKPDYSIDGKAIRYDCIINIDNIK